VLGVVTSHTTSRIPRQGSRSAVALGDNTKRGGREAQPSTPWTLDILCYLLLLLAVLGVVTKHTTSRIPRQGSRSAVHLVTTPSAAGECLLGSKDLQYSTFLGNWTFLVGHFLLLYTLPAPYHHPFHFNTPKINARWQRRCFDFYTPGKLLPMHHISNMVKKQQGAWR